MDREEDIEQFHDSEEGDIYDLYNACNGATLGGLLDVRRLDGLSAGESEALDVPRLREVWEHTKSGCRTCAGIIRTLNLTRGALRAQAIEHRQEAAVLGFSATVRQEEVAGEQ